MCTHSPTILELSARVHRSSRMICTDAPTILELSAGSPKFQNDVYRHTHLPSCNSASSPTPFQTDEHTLTYHPGTLCRFTRSLMLTTVLPAPALCGARRVCRSMRASKQATILTSVRGFHAYSPPGFHQFVVQPQHSYSPPAPPSSCTRTSRPVPDTDRRVLSLIHI